MAAKKLPNRLFHGSHLDLDVGTPLRKQDDGFAASNDGSWVEVLLEKA